MIVPNLYVEFISYAVLLVEIIATYFLKSESDDIRLYRPFGWLCDRHYLKVEPLK